MTFPSHHEDTCRQVNTVPLTYGWQMPHAEMLRKGWKYMPKYFSSLSRKIHWKALVTFILGMSFREN